MFNLPDPLTFDGNIKENWKSSTQEIELYLVATEKDKKENKVKSSILLFSFYLLHRSTRYIDHNTFIFSQKEDSFDYHVIVIAEVIVVLTNFDCEFGELKIFLIKSIVEIDVTDYSLKERTLTEPNLTLENARALGQSVEQTKIHAKELKQEEDIYGIKFGKVCMSTNKSLNYLDNQSTLPTTTEEIDEKQFLHWCHFWYFR